MDPATKAALRLDPSKLMERAGLRPDDWQRELLRTEADRVLLLCSRQLGKSTSVAFKALNTAYLNDDSLILLSSKTERQAGELFKKITYYHRRLDLVPSVRDMALTLELSNGSRIIALCGEGDNFRGFSDVRLALVDEASIVDESVLMALLPMLVVSGGRLIALSRRWASGGGFTSSGNPMIRPGNASTPRQSTALASTRPGSNNRSGTWASGSTARNSRTSSSKATDNYFLMTLYKPSSTIPTVKACFPR